MCLFPSKLREFNGQTLLLQADNDRETNSWYEAIVGAIEALVSEHVDSIAHYMSGGGGLLTYQDIWGCAFMSHFFTRNP